MIEARGLGADEITTLASFLGLEATALNNQTAVFACRGDAIARITASRS
jgi:hypothetical protein